ncbi:MAG: peptidase E [Actinomycetia bacterium]|nr:peptidase E [Actinomycetes bacterium]
MPADQPTILATSGGYVTHPRLFLRFGPLIEHAVELSGTTRTPRMAYLGTAGGDQLHWITHHDEAARLAGFDLRPVALFPMPNVDDLRETLLDQDVIWVGGGSVAGLLAMWQVHGLGPILREAWESGVVLSGVSAGSICWYQGGTTDSFGPELRAVTNGLALLPYGNGVHYDTEERRRPLVHSLVADGTFDEVHCTDDHVGLVYHGTDLVEAVSEKDGAGAYIVTRDDEGTVSEERLEPRRLPRTT